MNSATGNIIIIEEHQELNPVFSPGVHGSQLSAFTGIQDADVSLVIDRAAYTVYFRGEKISFPRKEFELLLLLASNPRKVFKREEILLQIWGKGFKAKDSRSLDVHIRMLRKKLDDSFITTIRGVGYKLER